MSKNTVGTPPKDLNIYIVMLNSKDTSNMIEKKIKSVSKHEPYKFSECSYFMSSKEHIEQVAIKLGLNTENEKVNGVVLDAKTTMVGFVDNKMLEWFDRILEQQTIH